MGSGSMRSNGVLDLSCPRVSRVGSIRSTSRRGGVLDFSFWSHFVHFSLSLSRESRRISSRILPSLAKVKQHRNPAQLDRIPRKFKMKENQRKRLTKCRTSSWTDPYHLIRYAW